MLTRPRMHYIVQSLYIVKRRESVRITPWFLTVARYCNSRFISSSSDNFMSYLWNNHSVPITLRLLGSFPTPICSVKAKKSMFLMKFLPQSFNSKIKIVKGTKIQKGIFYTALKKNFEIHCLFLKADPKALVFFKLTATLYLMIASSRWSTFHMICIIWNKKITKFNT